MIDIDLIPRKSDVFTLSFLSLQLITLSAKTDYQGITTIPRLPDEYTSDQHLKAFLTLVINGLNQSPTCRPLLREIKNHEFLHLTGPSHLLETPGELEFLEAIEPLMTGNKFRQESVRREASQRRGLSYP